MVKQYENGTFWYQQAIDHYFLKVTNYNYMAKNVMKLPQNYFPRNVISLQLQITSDYTQIHNFGIKIMKSAVLNIFCHILLL